MSAKDKALLRAEICILLAKAQAEDRRILAERAKGG
jgi:hypothetical protein